MERLAVLVAAVLVVSLAAPATPACDCKGDDLAAIDKSNAVPDGSAEKGTLDQVLTPQLVQDYLQLQLQRAALDMAVRSRTAGVGCSRSLLDSGHGGGPCGGGAEGRRRSKRFTSDSDVPVVAGLAGLAGLPSASPLVALRPRVANDDSNDVPVFKGNHEGTPLIRLVTPAPSAASRSGLRPASTTAPTVPVVKGSPDPAHPTTPRTDLQLSPEEQEALAVLLEGRHHKTPPAGLRPTPRPASRPASRPTPRPSTVTRISGKVGGKTTPTPGPDGQHRSGSNNNKDCCSERKLIAELERQLAILRQLNADHLREEWTRNSYPSPYYPYLHNLPIHPSRGYDGALIPTYFLSASDWLSSPLLPAPPPPARASWRPGPRGPRPRTRPLHQVAIDDCAEDPSAARDLPPDVDDSRAPTNGGVLDDKVHFSEPPQRVREVDELQGADPRDDVGIDPKVSEPVDVEIR